MRARKPTTIICGIWAFIMVLLYLISTEMSTSNVSQGQIKEPQEADRLRRFNKPPLGQQNEGQVQQQQPAPEEPAKEEKKEEAPPAPQQPAPEEPAKEEKKEEAPPAPQQPGAEEPAKEEKKEEAPNNVIPPPAQKQDEGWDGVIDIAIIIQGPKNATSAETMIKSLLYYQGRFQPDSNLCKSPLSEQTKSVCDKSISSQAFPLHVYVLADKEARQLINESAVKFQRKDIEWTLQNLEDYVPNGSLSSSENSPLPLSYFKATLPDILPKTVHKVLYLDPDLLFNRDVSMLWGYFKNFAANQAIGTAWITRKGGADNQTEVTSVRTGVLLMDMEKLRLQNWTEQWKASTSSHPCFDEVFKSHPEVFYRLPCDWNAELEDDGLPEYCPLVWPEIAHNIEDCVTNNGNFRLVHIAHIGNTNQTDVAQTADLPAIGKLSVEEKLTAQELRERFQRNYQSFVRIPPTCFQ